jgi:O-antigen/teichoic acid export membrane protein
MSELTSGASADADAMSPITASWSKRLAVGATWSVVSTTISYLASIVAYLITARLLGVANYGAFGLVNSTIGMFGILAGMGMGLTATKHVAEWLVPAPERAARVIRLTLSATALASIAVCAILWMTADVVAARFLRAPTLAPLLRLSSLMLFFGALSNAQNGVIAGFEAFRVLARVNIWRGVFAVAAQLVFVWRWGLIGAVLGMSATNALACWLNYRAIRRLSAANGLTGAGGAMHSMRSELPVLWKFSLPTTAAGLIPVVMQWLTNALLARQNGGFVQLGYLNAASNWRAIVTFLPFTIASAALPALSAITAENFESKHRRLELANALNQVVLWPIAIGTMLLGGLIVRSYGADFSAGRDVFVALVGGTAVGYVGNTVGTYVLSEGKTGFALAQNACFGLMLVVVAYVGIPRYGALAVAEGTGVAYLALLAGTAIYMWLLGKITGRLAIRLIVGGILMGVFTGIVAVVPSNLDAWLVIPGMILASGVSLALIPSDLRKRAFTLLQLIRTRRLSLLHSL